MNLDKALEEAGREAALWERLRLVVPPAAAEAAAQRPRLRRLAVHAAAVARQYNEVLGVGCMPAGACKVAIPDAPGFLRGSTCMQG